MLSKLLCGLLAAQTAQALVNCKVGWPIILADDDQDGDTEVQTWVSVGTSSTEEYLIGGRSTSLDFTEQDDICDKVGCAFLVLWRQVGSVLSNRIIYTEVQSVLDIQIDKTQDPYIAAVLFLQIESTQKGKYVIQFLENEGSYSDPWPAITRAYVFNEKIDLGQYSQFSTVMTYNNNFIQMYANLPSRYEIMDYFIQVDPVTHFITQVDTNLLATEGQFFNGMPTRKNGMMFGYDSAHVIQLATLTYSKGIQEFGGPVTLGVGTTYNIIISRTMYAYLDPIQWEDRLYGVQQVSTNLFYYWSRMSLSYIQNAYGLYTTDVLLHLAGQHSSRTKEIALTTYKVDSSHELEFQYSRIFEADGSVNVLGIRGKTTEDPDEIWTIYVFYTEYTISNRGKLLITDMKKSRELQVYYFQDTQENIDYLKQSVHISWFDWDGVNNVFHFGGRANYVQGYGDEIAQTFSWMDTKRSFGFMQIWTTEEDCYSTQDVIQLAHGPRFSEYMDGLDEILNIKLRSEATEGLTPLYTWNIGDFDDDDFDDLQLAEQAYQLELDDDYWENGFYVTYTDWRLEKTVEEDDGDERRVTNYRMFFIDGRNWVDRFNDRTSVEFQGKARDGSLAIMGLGINALADIALIFPIWFGFLNEGAKTSPKSLYWYSWLVIFIVVIVTQAGLIISWPTTYFGTSLSLEFAYSFTVVSMTGPYGLYEGSLIWLLVCLWSDASVCGYEPLAVSTMSENAQKGLWTALTIVFFGLNSFLSFYLKPQVKDYWLKIKAIEEAEEAAEENALQADGTLNDFGGPVFF